MLKDAEKLAAYGDNARLWAKAMRADAHLKGIGRLDEEWLYDWIAEAIEHADAVRRVQRSHHRKQCILSPICMGGSDD